jgi:hypothetical protein
LIGESHLKRALILCLIPIAVNAQNWPEWGQNPRHTGAVRVAGQRPVQALGQFTYDNLADQIRDDSGGELLVHYMAPLVDRDEVFTMSRGTSQWLSCRSGQPPCGTQRWGQMEWGVTKLRATPEGLEQQWTAISTWKPVPDNGSGWEPVFHPALYGGYVYVPAAAGMVMKLDRQSGELIDCLQPFDERDTSRFISSPLTTDTDGSIYYTVMKLDPAEPWTKDVEEAFLVKIDSAGQAQKVAFSDLVSSAPGEGCTAIFSEAALPWPPAPDAKPPSASCGSQRPCGPCRRIGRNHLRHQPGTFQLSLWIRGGNQRGPVSQVERIVARSFVRWLRRAPASERRTRRMPLRNADWSRPGNQRDAGRQGLRPVECVACGGSRRIGAIRSSQPVQLLARAHVSLQRGG